MNERQFEQHVTLLGWLYIVASAMLVALGLSMFLLFAGIGVAAQGEDPAVLPVLGTMGSLTAGLFVALALPGFLCGWGLLKRRPWARVFGLLLAFVHLWNVPLGTALGVYGLVVLLDHAAPGAFEGTGPALSAAG